MLSSVKVLDLGVCVGPFAMSRVRSKGAAPDNINRNSSRVKIGCTIAAPPLGQKLRAENMSTRQVAGALNEMGHRTQRGTPWNALTVSTSLNRELLSCAPAKWWSGFSASRRRQLAQTDPRSRGIRIRRSPRTSIQRGIAHPAASRGTLPR